MDALLWFFGALAVLSLLTLLGYQNGKVLALERRIAWLERITAPTPPKDPYRSPAACGRCDMRPDCDACPESSPAACQACHEEEEAHTRKGG